MTKLNDLGEIGRTRSQEQEAAYQRTIGKGRCPFCMSPLPAEIQSRMIHEGTYWRAWYNPFPYSGHQSHIILAPIEHWTQPSDVTPESAQEWFEINSRLIEQLDLPGGGLVMRFGDQSYKGGSLTHLHSHIQIPSREGFSIAVFYEDDNLKRFLRI